MKLSLFAGLEILEAGEPLSINNGAFTGRDREVVDRLLRIGAKTHRHTGANGLANPTVSPSASVVASGGSIGASLGLSIGYTEEDPDGGETMLSPVVTVSTASALGAPGGAPSAAVDTASGQLLVNTYFYGITYTDAEGGETSLGPAVNCERPPGFASGQIKLTHLNDRMLEVGAAGWRLYRAVGGETFNLLATGDASKSEFTDDGTHSLDCQTHPPAGESNTTNSINTLVVNLPTPIEGEWINVYATTTGDFSGGTLIGSFPAASGGMAAVFSSLEQRGSAPPPVNLSIGGAHQIDPDTELLDWHWKRPVATEGDLPVGAEDGDARVVLADGSIWIFAGAEWKLASAGGGGSTEGAMGAVWCGEDLTKVRPEFDVVTWITQGKGEEEPEHMAVHDILYALP